MKQRIIISIVLMAVLTTAISIKMYYFYRRTQIAYELVLKIPNGRKGFYPEAYVFFHSFRQLERFVSLTTESKSIGKEIEATDFDFNKYSYCLFFGKKITSMGYSAKEIYFDDPTPSYARTKGKIPVFVTYEKENTKDVTGVFLYRVLKNEKLRGFYE